MRWAVSPERPGVVVHSQSTLGETSFTLKDGGFRRSCTHLRGQQEALLELEVEVAHERAERMLAGVALSGRGHGRSGCLADPFGHFWIITQTP